MALLYPFLTTAEGIKTNMLGKDIFLKLFLSSSFLHVIFMNLSVLTKLLFFLSCQLSVTKDDL